MLGMCYPMSPSFKDFFKFHQMLLADTLRPEAFIKHTTPIYDDKYIKDNVQYLKDD